MKLFSFNKKNKPKYKLQITDVDRRWVNDNFQWLGEAFGMPRGTQKELNSTDFPKTIAGERSDFQNIIEDCCLHLDLNIKDFSVERFKDVRDLNDTAYGIEGEIQDCLLEWNSGTGKFKIQLAESLLKSHQRLLTSLCLVMVQARLQKSGVDFYLEADGEYFVYLAAVYFGYGAIIAQNLVDVGQSENALWKQSWNYSEKIPFPVLAFALAFYAKLKKQEDSEWVNNLPHAIQNETKLAFDYLDKRIYKLFDERRVDNSLQAEELFELAATYHKKGEYEKAIHELQKILFLTEDQNLRSDVYNNNGYNKTLMGDYEGSISDFKKAIEHDPSFAYPYDNLGHSLIMLGKLEEGKEYVDKAMSIEGNDENYSIRNMAIYHHKNGQLAKAGELFNSLCAGIGTVDTPDNFEFHFGLYLMETDQTDLGLKHLKNAASAGDRLAQLYLAKNKLT